MNINGVTHMSPEPMLEEKERNMTHSERDLWTLQNGKLKSGLTDRLSIYQEKLDVLGKYILFSISCIY